MNFTIPQKTFAAALGRCAAIAGTRSTMPILENVKLKPLDAVLKVSATDLETGYTTAIDGLNWLEKPAETSAITVSAKKLHECVKAIPAPEVTLIINYATDRVTVSGGTVSYTLAGLSADEFPEMPDVTGSQFDLDAPALVKILQAVAYAQCKNVEKYNLCGCLLKIEPNDDDEQFLTAVATDGHRVALDTVPLPGDPREIPVCLARGIIVPSKGVAEICKIQTPGIILLSIAGNMLCIATDNEKLYLRLIDGDYPDFDRVIPRHNDKRIEIKRPALIDALERCRIITSKDCRGVMMTATDGAVSLAASLDLIGAHAEDKVTAVTPDDGLQLRISVDYLLQTLESFACGVVEIQGKDESSPLLITPLGTCEPLAVIMPMRI